MNQDAESLPLPKPTVKVINNPTEFGDVTARSVMSNPVHVGVPPFPRLVSDEAWIRSAARMIEDEGAEQFLVNLLYMLRTSMVEAVPDASIPRDYDGPWPDDGQDAAEENYEDEDDWLEASTRPSPWQHPMEGFLVCSHDEMPMLLLNGEFVCVAEYLDVHINKSPVTDLIAEPILTLIFQNGHTLPLLCPDCGNSMHIVDANELLDDLNGLTIVEIEWDYDLEELILIFGEASSDLAEADASPALEVHLNSVRSLTCPQQNSHRHDEALG